jgi:hypothetical protein
MPLGAVQMVRDHLEWTTPVSMVGTVQSVYASVTAAQIHRAWTEMSEVLWKKNPVQLLSAELLLKERMDEVDLGEPEEDDAQSHVFCPSSHRPKITEMLERHFCAHPLIPGYSAPTPAGIREWAVRQMYTFCVENDLREVWAYLWENWYRPGRWELWARAANPEIPVLKTTMIMESQ